MNREGEAMRSTRQCMRGTAGRLAVTTLAMAAALLASPAAAVQYDLLVDVPTTLGGVTYTQNQIVRYHDGAYVLEASFPEEVPLAALLRTPEGKWLLSPAAVVPLDDGALEPRDLILFDPLDEDASVLVLDGSAAGVPAYAAIDAVLWDRVTDQGALSFDVPVNLGGVEYGPADLVALGAGGFSLFWSAAAAGVPPYANIVGADQDGAGRLVLSFDVPVTLGGLTFHPGQLVQWTSGGGFTLYASDPAWPASAVLGDFGFLPAAGGLPDGGAGSTALTVVPAAGGQITLSWGPSCAATDSDYAVYEGTLGAPFTSHVPVTCSTGGATSWTFTPGAGNRYYYVVPRNAVAEGSYGHVSVGAPRPPSAAACLPQEVAPSCG